MLHILIHSVEETLFTLPFLFLAYILIEYLEKVKTSKIQKALTHSGAYSPLLGACLGGLPQCSISAAAANLFSSGIITIGTIVAVFLATSDEMIPVLLSSSIPTLTVIRIVIYKILIAAFVGISIDTMYHLFTKHKPCAKISDLCDEHCHCDEHGIFYSALFHTMTTGLLIFVCNLGINGIIEFIGKDALVSMISSVPVLGHLIAAALGFIPNCAISVVLSSLYADGIISLGIMLSGLFTGAGMGGLILLKTHKCKKEALAVFGLTFIFGIIFGCISDIPIISQLILT